MVSQSSEKTSRKSEWRSLLSVKSWRRNTAWGRPGQGPGRGRGPAAAQAFMRGCWQGALEGSGWSWRGHFKPNTAGILASFQRELSKVSTGEGPGHKERMLITKAIGRVMSGSYIYLLLCGLWEAELVPVQVEGHYRPSDHTKWTLRQWYYGLVKLNSQHDPIPNSL